MMNRTKASRDLGIARTTLHRWLNLPECPNPDTDEEAFLIWAREMKAAGNGSKPDPSALKESKLRAEVVWRWQRIEKYEAVIRDTQKECDWEEVADALAEYQSELFRLVARAPAQMEPLTSALARALERVRCRRDNAKTRLAASMAALRALVLSSGQEKQPAGGAPALRD